MKPKVIRTKVGHKAALARVDVLLNAKPGTAAEEELGVWSALIHDWEEEQMPIAPPDPVDAIHFRMEQGGYATSDLAALLGGRSRVSEVLNRKRPLTLDMIRRLHTEWGIPPDSLIQPIPLRTCPSFPAVEACDPAWDSLESNPPASPPCCEEAAGWPKY